MWFDTDPVPLEFTLSSPFHIETVTRIEASPERVFDILATGERQAEWFQDFVENRWTTANRGVGAEREVELKLLSVKERFLAWDRGRRLACLACAHGCKPEGQNLTRCLMARVLDGKLAGLGSRIGKLPVGLRFAP